MDLGRGERGKRGEERESGPARHDPRSLYARCGSRNCDMVQDGESCQLNSSSAWTLGGCAWGQSMRAIESSTRAGGMESHPAEGRKEVGDACHGRESRRKGRSTATFCRAGCFLACFDGAQWRAKGIFDFAACHLHRLFVVPGTLFCVVSESECGYLESSHREPDLAR